PPPPGPGSKRYPCPPPLPLGISQADHWRCERLVLGGCLMASSHLPCDYRGGGGPVWPGAGAARGGNRTFFGARAGGSRGDNRLYLGGSRRIQERSPLFTHRRPCRCKRGVTHGVGESGGAKGQTSRRMLRLRGAYRSRSAGDCEDQSGHRHQRNGNDGPPKGVDAECRTRGHGAPHETRRIQQALGRREKERWRRSVFRSARQAISTRAVWPESKKDK